MLSMKRKILAGMVVLVFVMTVVVPVVNSENLKTSGEGDVLVVTFDDYISVLEKNLREGQKVLIYIHGIDTTAEKHREHGLKLKEQHNVDKVILLEWRKDRGKSGSGYDFTHFSEDNIAYMINPAAQTSKLLKEAGKDAIDNWPLFNDPRHESLKEPGRLSGEVRMLVNIITGKPPNAYANSKGAVVALAGDIHLDERAPYSRDKIEKYGKIDEFIFTGTILPENTDLTATKKFARTIRNYYNKDDIANLIPGVTGKLNDLSEEENIAIPDSELTDYIPITDCIAITDYMSDHVSVTDYDPTGGIAWKAVSLVEKGVVKGTAVHLGWSDWSVRDVIKTSGEDSFDKKRSTGGVDFTSIQLNYLSTYSDKSNQISKFNYALKAKKAENGDKIIDIEDATELSLSSFFIGLTLPESKFWVNLNPWEPDVITDEDLRKTDMGRIMLEADLRMKKDFCKYKNPCESKIGEDYWKLLDKKSEELSKECMRKHPGEIEDADNVLFSPVTRHWIVPDKTDTYGTGDEVYIVDLTLNIKSEPVYEHSTYEIANQNPFVSDECKEDLSEAAKEYGRYAMELEEEMILPLVVQDVNHDWNYSDLRQVYTSLALAQWYKDKYWHTSGIFTDLIDSKDLEGLESKSAWSAEAIWRGYNKSFEEGEYHCWKNETTEETYREGDYIVTETITSAKLYSGGGVDFTAIKLTNIDVMPPDLKELTSEAVYAPFASEGDDYYFGDGLYVFYPSSTPTTEVPTPKPPGFEAIFAIAGLLIVKILINRNKKGKE